MAHKLAGVPLFEGLDDATLVELGEALEERNFTGGELLCEEGSTGHECYFIIEGQVNVSKIIDKDDGREKVLATLQAGDFFGEMALLEDSPRSANVRAAGPTRVLILSRDSFWSLLDREADVAVKMLFGIISTIVGRLRRTSTELVALFDTGKIVGSITDLPTLCAKILERLRESIGLDCGLMLLKNPYTQKLEVQEIIGYPAGTGMQLNLATDQGLLGHLFTNRSPFLFNNFQPPEGLTPHGFELPKMVGAPLIANEDVTGVIILGSSTSTRTMDMNHLNLLLGISMQVATAVENARRREEDKAKKRHGRHFVTF